MTLFPWAYSEAPPSDMDRKMEEIINPGYLYFEGRGNGGLQGPGLGGTNLKMWIYPHGLTFLDAISAQLLHHWCNDPIHEFWSTQHGHAYQDLVILHSFSLVFNKWLWTEFLISMACNLVTKEHLFFRYYQACGLQLKWIEFELVRNVTMFKEIPK